MTDNQILHEALKKCGWAIEVKDNKYVSYNHSFEIIFSHDFAKAFWGEDYYGDDGYGFFITKLNWQYHLHQMVLEKEPLKYLEQFLDNS